MEMFGGGPHMRESSFDVTVWTSVIVAMSVNHFMKMAFDSFDFMSQIVESFLLSSAFLKVPFF